MLFIAAMRLSRVMARTPFRRLRTKCRNTIGQTLALSATRFFARAFEALAELAVEGGREEGSRNPHDIPSEARDVPM